MTTDSERTAKMLPKRRGKGRPVTGENDVGRERLLEATEHLLRTLPPARVTISRIAQEAKVDPALVRYYFGGRTALLIAVVDRITAHANRKIDAAGPAIDKLSSHIAQTVQLVSRAPFMHRLMIDELAAAGTDESRARVRSMNADLVEYYSNLLKRDQGENLVGFNALFLHIAVLGASDFFSSAEALIKDLVPPGTDMHGLTKDFENFLIKLVLDGLRKR